MAKNPLMIREDCDIIGADLSRAVGISHFVRNDILDQKDKVSFSRNFNQYLLR